MVHDNGTSGDGKAKTSSADLSGMGFIHAVKALKDPLNGILRNSKSGICYCHIKILVVCIQRYTSTSFIYIVCESDFNKDDDSER